MPNFFNENLQIIQRRWPQVATALKAARPEPRAELVNDGPQATLLIDGTHLTSSYDREAEAALQASLIPEESPEAWVYGVALGDLPRHLLQRPQMQCLHVVLLNPSVTRQSFEHFDHGDWLGDNRVEILTAANQKTIHFPFAAAPACLQLADDVSARLRDLVVLELATPFIRKRHTAESPELMARIRENESVIAADEDVVQLFDRYEGETVLVAAAGPSLSEHYKRLRHRKAPLIAVDAALKPLTQAGVVPEVVVTMDYFIEAIGPFFSEADLGACGDTALVYFPTTHRDILASWPGKRLCAYPNSSSLADLRKRIHRETLYSSGSVIHPAVDLAVRTGARKVVLFGADFGFPGGKSHVENSVHARQVSMDVKEDWVLDGHGRRIPTLPNLRGYLRDLETYIARRNAVVFRNASLSGAQIQGALSLKDGEDDF